MPRSTSWPGATSSANPLDYVESSPRNKRREKISEWLDSTDPDISAFYRRRGKMIVTVGTDDPRASPVARLDYFQSTEPLAEELAYNERTSLK